MTNELYREAQALLAQDKLAEAAAIYKDLANAGDVQSQIFIGWMHLKGFGVNKDPEMAYGWFERAATLGSKEGIYRCGDYWFRLKDFKSAFEWVNQSVVKDYAPALLLLGSMYIKGLGTKPDQEMGIKYIERAANLGNWLARRELSVLMIQGKLGIARIPLGLILFLHSIIGIIGSGLTQLRAYKNPYQQSGSG